VLTYTEDLSSTVVAGLPEDPVSDGLGPYELDYSFANHSDGLIPTASASPAFVGEEGQVAALSHEDRGRGFKTVFLAFPFEALAPEDAQEVLGRIIEWLHPMVPSTVAVDKPIAAEGDRLTYTLVLRNDGPRMTREASLFNRLPEEVSFVEGSLTGDATYEPGDHVVRWQGDLLPDEDHAIAYQVLLPSPVDEGTVITNVVEVDDGTGLEFQRAAVTRVNVPDLSPSTKWGDRAEARLGEVLTYLIILRNAGTLDEPEARVTDRVPPQATLVPGSLSASAGTVEEEDGVIRWRGPVNRGHLIAIGYQVQITSPRGGTIVNAARIKDSFGQVIERQAATVVPVNLYFPLVAR
jgi:uncharacterized repeat protein (TIGR01451 family)